MARVQITRILVVTSPWLDTKTAFPNMQVSDIIEMEQEMGLEEVLDNLGVCDVKQHGNAMVMFLPDEELK